MTCALALDLGLLLGSVLDVVGGGSAIGGNDSCEDRR